MRHIDREKYIDRVDRSGRSSRSGRLWMYVVMSVKRQTQKINRTTIQRLLSLPSDPSLSLYTWIKTPNYKQYQQVSYVQLSTYLCCVSPRSIDRDHTDSFVVGVSTTGGDKRRCNGDMRSVEGARPIYHKACHKVPHSTTQYWKK